MLNRGQKQFLCGCGKYCAYAAILFLLFHRAYIYRAFYPYIYGEPTTEKMQISAQDSFADIENAVPFKYTANGQTVIMTPLTHYSVTGKIVYIERYDGWFQKFAYGHNPSHTIYNAFAPLDLAIVHGEMSRPENLRNFKFGHEYRAAKTWSKKRFNYSQYLNNFNNYHIIPASLKIRKALDCLLNRDIIYLEGILVNVESPTEKWFKLNTGTRHNQWHDDLYGGQYAPMCFIIYVTKIILQNRVYE